MSDTWSLLAQAAGYVAFVFLALAFWGLNFWLGAIVPQRKAKAALAVLAGPLGLTLGGRSESIWPDSRDQFAWTDWPLARGTRGAFRVEVQVQPGVRWISALTYVVVAGPRSAGGKVSVSRQSEMLTYKQTAKLVPWLPRPASSNSETKAATDFLGEVAVFGEVSHIPRLFAPALRAQLQALPRQLMAIGFDGPILHLAWLGVEQDPAVVERAFQIAAGCLQALSETSRV